MTWTRFYRQTRLSMNSKVICHQMADSDKADLTFSDWDKPFLKNFLDKYVSWLKESIKNRFPTIPVLSAFAIFNPAQVPERHEAGFSEYGNENVKLLAQQYFDRECDRKELVDEWQVLKYNFVKLKKELPEEVRKPPGGKIPTITPTDWCLKRLLCLKDLVPFNLPLVPHKANAVVSLPVSSSVVTISYGILRKYYILHMKFLDFFLHNHNSCEIWHLFSWTSVRNFLWCYYRWFITFLGVEKCKKECNIL